MDNEEFIEEMEWLLIEQKTLLIALQLINLNQRMELNRLNNKFDKINNILDFE